MKLKEKIKEEYQRDVEHFGKLQTIILYALVLILFLTGIIGGILGLIDEKFQTVCIIVLFGVGGLSILYLIIICIMAKLKGKGQRLLLTLNCIEKGENITYKYNYHIAREYVPELLIRSSLAMLKYDREEVLKILDEVCNNPDTPVEKEGE